MPEHVKIPKPDPQVRRRLVDEVIKAALEMVDLNAEQVAAGTIWTMVPDEWQPLVDACRALDEHDFPEMRRTDEDS